MSARIAILTSGMSRGSNFEAIFNYFHKHRLPVSISFVTINREDAPIKERCERLKVPCHFLPTSDLAVFEEQLHALVDAHRIDLIVLAGFMRKLSGEFLKTVGCPVINIHPALLPKYGGKGMYGMAVHQAVFEAREGASGVTVHYVSDEYDAGEIIARKTVSIRQCKTAEEVARKVLKEEHSLYPKTIWSLLRSHKRLRRSAKRSLITYAL